MSDLTITDVDGDRLIVLEELHLDRMQIEIQRKDESRCLLPTVIITKEDAFKIIDHIIKVFELSGYE